MLFDVTFLTSGIETAGDTMIKLIKGNSTISAKKTQTFVINVNNKFGVLIQVDESQRQTMQNDQLLNTFNFEDILFVTRFSPQMELTFDINSSRILDASVQDKSIDDVKSVTIANDKGRSSAEKIGWLTCGIEKSEDSDKLFMKRVEVMNSRERSATSLKHTISNDKLEDKIPEADEKKCLMPPVASIPGFTPTSTRPSKNPKLRTRNERASLPSFRRSSMGKAKPTVFRLF